MRPSKHQPEPDAPAEQWQEYLKGNGYTPDSEPQPFANYRSFHGYWVPPRVGQLGSGAAPGTIAAPRKPRGDVNTSWYSTEYLTMLYRNHRRTFDLLRERIEHVEKVEAGDPVAELVAERRFLLSAAVEAGLMNQTEADKRLAEWVAAQEHNG